MTEADTNEVLFSFSRERLAQLGADIQKIDGEFFEERNIIMDRMGHPETEWDHRELEYQIANAWNRRCGARDPLVQEYDYLLRQMMIVKMAEPLTFQISKETP